MKGRKKIDCKMFSMKFRLYPSFEQVTHLNHSIFIYNQAYNIAIDKLKELYKNKQRFPDTNDLRQEVQVILEKRKLKYNSKVVQYAIDNCKSNYYKYQKPNYKISRKLIDSPQSFITDNQTFTFIQNNKNDSYLHLFRKDIKLKLHRKMPEDIFKAKMISVKRNSCNQWHVTITFDIIDEVKFKEMNIKKFEKNDVLCGIDTNKDNITLHISQINPKLQDKIKKLAKGQLKSKQHNQVDDKSIIDYLSVDLENTINDIDKETHKDNAKKVACEQVLSKIYLKYHTLMIEEAKKEYSKEYSFEIYKIFTNENNEKCLVINQYNKKPELTKAALQRIITLLKENIHDYKLYLKNYYKKNKLRLKTNNIKQDKINKTSNLLMSCFDTIIIEKLDVQKMKDKKRSDKTLRKKLQSSQFGKYLEMIILGTRLFDKQLITVAAPYTSSTCHYCGTIHTNDDKEVWRPSQSVFVCQSCKNTYNADENAATNITMQGLALLKKETRD